MASQNAILVFAITVIALTMPVYSQINTSCTPSMITTFSPCISFITNSSANGTSPNPACCTALRSVTSNGTDCLCLIASGVPFQIPINRTLAVSLPRACNMPGVPLQCRVAGAPAPAPGAVAASPTSPASSPTGSTVPESASPTLAPVSDDTPSMTPPATTGSTAGAPTTNTDRRPVLTPSSDATSSYGLSSSILLVVVGTMLKFF